MSKKYAYATTDDSWCWEGEYATREDAAQSAREEFGPGEDFVTGVRRDATRADVYPDGMAVTLLDRMLELDHIESGTPVETYVTDAYNAVIKPALGGKDTRLLADLERRLKAAYLDWANEHLPAPNWFFVEDVQGHGAEEGESA